jgi:hypothetical protein
MARSGISKLTGRFHEVQDTLIDKGPPEETNKENFENLKRIFVGKKHQN